MCVCTYIYIYIYILSPPRNGKTRNKTLLAKTEPRQNDKTRNAKGSKRTQQPS